MVKKDRQSRHTGSVATSVLKTDRSVVSYQEASATEHPAKPLIKNNTSKESEISALDPNDDTLKKYKNEHVAPVVVQEVGDVMDNHEIEKQPQLTSPKAQLIRATISRHNQF